MLICIDTRYTAYNVKMIHQYSLQVSHLPWQLTHPITLTVGQYLVNHCFSSTPFILNQEVGMQHEAPGWIANERAATQAAVG